MISIPVSFRSDEKGYIDRKCPNPDCSYMFKVLMKDWEEKVSDEAVHCPMCGYIDTSDKWITDEQLAQIKQIAISWAQKYVQDTFEEAFRDLEHSTRNNKFVKVKYNPGERVSFVNNPVGQREEWSTEICCESCGTHYSVIGSAYFCPCCGHNSAISAFSDSINSERKMLDSVSEMRKLFSEKYDDDTADTMCRGLIESSLGDIVAAFQKFACSKYEEKGGTVRRTNDFQIIEKGSELFKQCTGKGYDAWLSAAELSRINLLFQRRHLLEHNGGMIDQKYLDKSGDTSYVIGQRVVIKLSDAYELLGLIEKLSNGLMAL